MAEDNSRPKRQRRQRQPVIGDKAFRSFMRAATKPVPLEPEPKEWHVGFLTRELWEIMSPEPRKELWHLVNAAVIQICEKYGSQ